MPDDFLLPFSFDGDFVAVEADTEAAYHTQVTALLSCPLDWRDDLPEYGVEPPVGQIAPVDTAQYAAAAARWIPAVDVDFTEDGDALDQSIRRIQALVHQAGEGV